MYIQENWAIVGGGILGMTVAYRLAQQGKKVTLLEAGSELGGLTSAWQIGDVIWDRYYHVILPNDIHLRSLLAELDLEKDLQWVQTKTGVYGEGKLYSLSNTLEFFTFPLLNLIDKFRLGLTLVWGSKIKNWQKLEAILAVDWLRMWSGKRTFKKFWLPLLRSKLGDNYQKASAAFIWAIIVRLYQARQTSLKKESFGYLPGGYSRILQSFQKVLETEGVIIKLNHKAKEIKKGAGTCLVELESGEVIQCNNIIVTVPSPIAAKLCPQLTSEEKSRLLNIEYQGIICASLLLKRPLAQFYVTNIIEDGLPFTGVIEMSSLVDKTQFGGYSLVYLPKYIPSNDPAFQLSDEAIQKEFMNALFVMYPHIQPDDLITFQVSRVSYVLAVSTLNYSQSLPPINTSLNGIYILNSAHIVNGTLNVNETIQLAENFVQDILHVPVMSSL